MDLDSQTPSGRIHDSSHVCFTTEPQGTTKGEARCQGLGNEPPSAVLSSQLCCLVQQGTGVQYLKNFWVGETDTDSVPTSGAQKGQCTGDLASPGGVESLQTAPVTVWWQKEILRVGKSFGPVAADC
jgi:hypothetical protein